jgi:hypothetical protein
MSDTKFSRMLHLLGGDSQARRELLRDPEAVLTRLGVDGSILENTYDRDALRRGEDIVSSARISPQDDVVTSLKKLGDAAEKALPNGYDVAVTPFGLTLMERVSNPTALDVTATATSSCTFNPWDGCKGDPDW